MPLDGDVDRLIHCVDDFKLDMYPTPCNLESTRTFTMSCRMHIPSSGSRQLPAVVAGAVRRTAYPQRVWMPSIEWIQRKIGAPLVFNVACEHL